MSKTKKGITAFVYAISLIGLSICLTACPDDEMEENSLNFYNNSLSDIYIYFGIPRGEKGKPTLPDTMIPIQYNSLGDHPVSKNGGYVYFEYRHFKGESYIYHLYIFDADTVNKYSWDEIRADYKVLKRYDLNIENGLKEFKGVITYPPSEAMKDVPMFPPYQ